MNLHERVRAPHPRVKPPDPIPGVEIRERRNRNGDPTYEYRVRWKDPVTGKRLVEVCHTPEDALDFKAHLRLLKRRGKLEDLDRGRVHLDTFAARWVNDWAKANVAARTLKAYAGHYDRHLLPRVGHLQLRHITPAVVDQLKADLMAAGVGGPTIRKALGILSSMMSQAVVWGEVEFNPVREVKKPPARRAKVITPLTVEQVEGMLAYLTEHGTPADRMLVELLAYGAGRPQDVLALTWEMVGQRRLVYAFKNVDGRIMPGAKSGGDRARSVAMLKTLRADLLAYRMEMGNPGPGALVVAKADGRAWREADYGNWHVRVARGRRRADGVRTGRPGPFARAAAAVDAPKATPYTLRHTYASLRIAEQSLSLQEIADELGHDVDVLASTYAHVISEYRGQGPIDIDALIGEARSRPQNAPSKEAGDA